MVRPRRRWRVAARIVAASAAAVVIAACGSSSPSSSGPSGHRNQAQILQQIHHQLLSFARCMRSHGVSHFPDPTSAPPSNQTAYANVIGISGPHAPPGAPSVAYLPIPNSISVSSPAAQHAATACHFRLR
jgi:hypothetical protein